jgi:molybdate transport system substrate-binding protein
MNQLGLLFLTILAAGCRNITAQDAPLRVFAASSLTESFREIGTRFTGEFPRARIHFNFAGSQQLASQLELAGGADVYASGDERWMRRAEEKSLIYGEPVSFASNDMVVIFPTGNPANLQSIEDLGRPGIRVVLAGEAVPAGQYSRELIGRLASSPGYSGDFFHRVMGNVVSDEESVRGVLGKVILGEADAGIVYRTDVTSANSSRIRRLEVPDDLNVAAHYLIARVGGSSQSTLADEFIKLVISPEGQAILQRHGFRPATP